MLIAAGWILLWIVGGSAYTAGKEGAALVRAGGRLLPAFAATTCLLLFALNPTRGETTRQIVLWVHHAGFLGLFAFLAAAQFLQVEAGWKRSFARPASAIAASYRRLWVLTELLPGALAATIFLTGLRLLWEAPADTSPAQVWLLIIIATFGMFFADGIVGYTPIVRRWANDGDDAAPPEPAMPARPPTMGEHLQLLSHFLSWPILFALGVFRIDVGNPVSRSIEIAQHGMTFLPRGWPAIVVAVALWSLGAAAIVALRLIFRSA